MSASPRWRFGFAAAGLSCLMAGYVVAQQQTERNPQGTAVEQPAGQNPRIGQTDRSATPRPGNFTDNPANAGTQTQEVQRYIVGCLLTKNQAEVEAAQFAQQKARTPEVKEFAVQLVQDHGKLVQMLQKLAGAQTGARSGERTLPAANRDAAGQNAAELATSDRTVGTNSPVDQLLAMERQIVERCTQMAREELEQKQGVEFDKAYICHQIGGHMRMLAALEVIQQQAPEQLQQLAQQVQPQVQQHLDHAKQIIKQLDGANPTGTRAARQATEPQR